MLHKSCQTCRITIFILRVPLRYRAFDFCGEFLIFLGAVFSFSRCGWEKWVVGEKKRRGITVERRCGMEIGRLECCEDLGLRGYGRDGFALLKRLVFGGNGEIWSDEFGVGNVFFFFFFSIFMARSRRRAHEAESVFLYTKEVISLGGSTWVRGPECGIR